MTNKCSVEMTIGPRDGKVIQRFKTPMEEVIYDPDNAISIAEAMANAAFEAREGVKPASDALKAELVERHRMTLTHRITHMLATARHDKKKTDGRLAQDVVEACLREVF